MKSTRSEFSLTWCRDYTSPSGKVWTESGVYADTIPNSAGCDSIIKITLDINAIEVDVQQDGDSLIAVATEIEYQWLDCDNDYQPVEGAVNQTFRPLQTGNFALEAKKDGCVDTSECKNVVISGLEYNEFGDRLKVFPNPARTNIFIQLAETYEFVDVELRNAAGATVLSERHYNDRKFQINPKESKGIHLLTIRSNKGQKAVIKIVLE